MSEKMIRKYAGGSSIFVGGNENFQNVYCALLGHDNVIPIEKSLAATASLRGLQELYRIRKALQSNHEVKEEIERSKIISIIRNPNSHSLLSAVNALYEGGIRLAEVKTTNLGSLNRLTYELTLSKSGTEKEFIDELRCRNGNLEISMSYLSTESRELL